MVVPVTKRYHSHQPIPGTGIKYDVDAWNRMHNWIEVHDVPAVKVRHEIALSVLRSPEIEQDVYNLQLFAGQYLAICEFMAGIALEVTPTLQELFAHTNPSQG